MTKIYPIFVRKATVRFEPEPPGVGIHPSVEFGVAANANVGVAATVPQVDVALTGPVVGVQPSANVALEPAQAPGVGVHASFDAALEAAPSPTIGVRASVEAAMEAAPGPTVGVSPSVPHVDAVLSGPTVGVAPAVEAAMEASPSPTVGVSPTIPTMAAALGPSVQVAPTTPQMDAVFTGPSVQVAPTVSTVKAVLTGPSVVVDPTVPQMDAVFGGATGVFGPSTDPNDPVRLLGGEVAVWQMDADDHDQPAANQTRDSSGNGYHLTKAGTATNQAGKFGNGYSFAANSGYHRTQTELQIIGDLSVTFWLKRNGVVGGQSGFIQCGRGGNPTAADHRIYVAATASSAGQPFQYTHRNHAIGTNHVATGSSIPNDNTWHLYGFVRDAMAKTIKLIEQGILGSANGYVNNPDAASDAALAVWGANLTDYFATPVNVMVDEVRIFDGVKLTQADLDDLASGPYSGAEQAFIGVNALPSIPQVDAALTGPSIRVAPTIPDAAVALTGPNVAVAPTIPQVSAILTGPSVGAAASTPAVAAALTGPSIGADVTELRVVTSAILASKDSWVPTAKAAGICIDDANKNGQDLKVSRVAADNDARAIFAFDLTGLPATATLLSAILTVGKKAQGVSAAVDVEVASIASGDEGWDEATVKCSTIPADGATTESFTLTGSTVNEDQALTLGAAFRTYVEDRLGSATTCTFKMRESTGVALGRTLQSTDEGTDDDKGPRLTLTFTIPV